MHQAVSVLSTSGYRTCIGLAHTGHAVKHENVLRVLAYNEEGCPEGNLYLVVPFMSGDTNVNMWWCADQFDVLALYRW